MPEHQLDYAGKAGNPSPICRGWITTALFGLVWVAANLLLLFVSRSIIGGFEGMGAIVLGGMALNAFSLIVAIPVAVWLGRTAGVPVPGVFLVVGVLFPAIVLGAAIWIISG